MVTTEGEQEIPADLLFLYDGTLKYSNAPRRRSGKRYPWRLKHMQKGGSGVTAKQQAHRDLFSACVDCYKMQPYIGGVTPPTQGPRNRSWWFAAAGGSGLWYFDYFVQQTIAVIAGPDRVLWCWKDCLGSAYVLSSLPDNNYDALPLLFVGGSFYNTHWAFFKNSDYDVTYINIYLKNWGGDASRDDSITIDVFAVTETWNDATVTWNTRPAVGPHLSSFEKPNLWEGWVKVECAGLAGIALRMKSSLPKRYVEFTRHKNWGVLNAYLS